MTESQSISIVNLNGKRGSVIIEIETNLEGFYLIEHHFLTISTMRQKEKKLSNKKKGKTQGD